MTDSKEMQEAFKDWVNPDTGWEYPSPYTGFAKAWEIQEGKYFILECNLKLAIEALEVAEEIIGDGKGYRRAYESIRETLNQIKETK